MASALAPVVTCLLQLVLAQAASSSVQGFPLPLRQSRRVAFMLCWTGLGEVPEGSPLPSLTPASYDPCIN